MAPPKRKRSLEPATATAQPRKNAATAAPIATEPDPSSSPIPRRATRSIGPLLAPQELPPRRRRRLNTGDPLPTAVIPSTGRDSLEPPRGKENIPVDLKQTQSTRIGGFSAGARPSSSSADNDDKKRPSTFTPVPVPTIPPQPEHAMRSLQRDSGKTKGLSNLRAPDRPAAAQLVLPSHPHTVGRTKPITMATSGTQQRQSPPPSAPGPPGAAEQDGRVSGSRPKQPQEPDRNIDNVVLGDIFFRAWYPSYYGKEVLGEGASSHSTHSKGGKNGKGPSSQGTSTNGTSAEGCQADGHGGKAHGRRGHDAPPILDRLYVCPCCFKYSKELVTWWKHVHLCQQHSVIPGTKIYIHPKGQRTVRVPSGPPFKPARGKRASGGPKVVEEIIQDQGEWSIYEVDGEKDVLFCQNLSLFAKLFLDNKSVFFDVTGFKYFLLVYTPPSPTDPLAPVQRSHIVGFFSKEKMSWDNNNLACILIFPPWQRKGLGALLMGVSYEISRREGVLGGPEKPISDLGKKGYKRFWAGEIARWLLTLEVKEGEETVVDVNECSAATWIAPDDCLLVLRDMGVAEDAGRGPPRVRKMEGADQDELNGGEEVKEVEEVQRVRISQDAVRSWILNNKISLERSCDPAGFVEGYTMKGVEEEEENP